jgi:DNA recombination protein RmuC
MLAGTSNASRRQKINGMTNLIPDLKLYPFLWPILTFILGAMLSSLFWWFRRRYTIKQAHERVTACFNADLAVLHERLGARDIQVTELKLDLAEARKRHQELLEDNTGLQNRHAALSARIDEERQKHAEKLLLLTEAQQKLADAFKALAAEALSSNNQSFLQLAGTVLEKFQQQAQGDLNGRQKAIDALVQPIQESLQKVDGKLQDLEKERIRAYAGLLEQIKSLGVTQTDLKAETAKLVNALRTPAVKGRWGEIQLRRVVEIAGMLPYVDFVEQVSAATEAGKLRPDLIVNLPGGKSLVIDAKAPLQAYLNAMELPEEVQRHSLLKSHAKLIRNHMSKLSSKQYWEQFHPTPEFVVMFLPGEMFFSAALEQNSDLIEEGVTQRVIPASPTTLIALLRAVAYGWRQEKLAENAHEISNLGKMLYERLRIFIDYMEKLGAGLKTAIDAYNRAIGSLESRILVAARKFPDLGAVAESELPTLDQIEKVPRSITPVLEIEK